MKQALLGILASALVLTTAMAMAEDDGFVSLFNGKTLDGWTQRNGIATYRVEDGTIIGRTAKSSPNSFLCSNKAYCDFELQFDVHVDPDLNSGVQIRSRSSKDYSNERVHGPQVEIMRAPGASGYIYGEATGRGWLSAKRDVNDAAKNDDWNTFRVLAVGPRIQTWINGKQVADVADDEAYAKYPSGVIALQVHGVKKSPENARQVSFRAIRIRRIDSAN